MSLEIKGKITHVLEPITGTSDKGEWEKQTFVLLTEDTYPKSIAFDVFNDKIPAPKLNDEVTVSINLESREFNGKWYTNVGAWKIESVGQSLGDESPKENEELELDEMPF